MCLLSLSDTTVDLRLNRCCRLRLRLPCYLCLQVLMACSVTIESWVLLYLMQLSPSPSLLLSPSLLSSRLRHYCRLRLLLSTLLSLSLRLRFSLCLSVHAAGWKHLLIYLLTFNWYHWLVLKLNQFIFFIVRCSLFIVVSIDVWSGVEVRNNLGRITKTIHMGGC